MLHFPVLLEESIDFLVQKNDGTFIDCTFGRGGHSKNILEKIHKNGFLTSFDKDPDAIKFAKKITQKNFNIIHDSFCNLNKYFKENSVDGILYDLGTCSTHFDDPERGFSFKKDGPLDMRFDNTNGESLIDWINNAPESEIMKILYTYGDEKHGKLISKKIISERQKNPILRTIQLADLIKNIYPEKQKKNHPATKSFQAFRIFINNELDELEESLRSAQHIIRKNGIIVTIAFHSLEDNIIKNCFKPKEKHYPRDIPLNNERIITFKCIAKKIRPSNNEIKTNPRSRSAIMRVFQKI